MQARILVSAGSGWEGLGRAGKGWEGLGMPAWDKLDENYVIRDGAFRCRDG